MYVINSNELVSLLGNDADNHLILLAKDYKGYQNLIKLVSIAYTEGFYYKPRIDLEVLKEYSEDLIALSGCMAGAVARKIAEGDIAGAKETALKYKEISTKEPEKMKEII